MEPPGSVELPLAGYGTATLLSVGGVVTSRGIEPRSLGLQPSAMTTLARWSFWWSRRRESNPRLRVTRAPCFRQHFVDVVQARGFEPRFSGNRPDVLPLDEAWVGPVGWSRTTIVPLKRRGHCRSATTGYDETRLAVGPGFEPGSFRLTAGRVAVATTLQMVGSGGLEPPRACARGRWAADYPTTRRMSWGERPESNRLERVSQTRGAPFAFAHRRICSRGGK